MPQFFGELTPNGRPSTAGSLVLADRSTIHYVWTEPDLCGSSFPLAVAHVNGCAAASWRLYTQKEVAAVARLTADHPRILTLGHAVDEIATSADTAPTAARRQDEEPEPEDNSLQTAKEAELFNLNLGEVAKGVFADAEGKQQCPESFKNTVTDLRTVGLFGEQVVEGLPFQTIISQCFSGVITTQIFNFPVPGRPDLVSQPTVCFQTYSSKETREAFIEQISKSSKLAIGFALSVSFGGGRAASTATQQRSEKERREEEEEQKDKTVEPKKGDQVHSKGRPVIGVKFGFEQIKTWSRLRFRAVRRFEEKVEEVQCKAVQ